MPREPLEREKKRERARLEKGKKLGDIIIRREEASVESLAQKIPLTVTAETRYTSVRAPKGRGVQCLQWYQSKQGRIPTVDELTQYRTQFTPMLKSLSGGKEWQLY